MLIDFSYKFVILPNVKYFGSIKYNIAVQIINRKIVVK